MTLAVMLMELLFVVTEQWLMTGEGRQEGRKQKRKERREGERKEEDRGKFKAVFKSRTQIFVSQVVTHNRIPGS